MSQASDVTDDWIGDTLGIPRNGPGSIASWPRRIIAFAVDGWALNTLQIWPWGGGAAEWAWTRSPLLVVAAAVVNFVLLPAFTGRTAGKAVCCLRIRGRTDDQPPGVKRMLVRAGVAYIPIVAWITMDDDRRHWFDRKARTMVVDTAAWWQPSAWRRVRRTAELGRDS